MKYVDIRDLPPCSFSPQCLRLIDDLDMPITAPVPARLAYIEDLQDERHLRQLRSHVPKCPTCSALLAEARRMRTQQRMMLYHYMTTNERQVPATSGAIFEALRHENVAEEASATRKLETHTREQRVSKRAPASQETASASSPIPLYTRSPQHRRILQNVLTLATVAAVILAAVGLLNRFTVQFGAISNSSTGTSHPNQTPNTSSAGNNDGWNSVLFSLTVLTTASAVKSLAVYNYDTSSGQMTPLVSATQTFSAVTVEGVSEDGQSLLYDETSTSQQKSYKTYSTATNVQTIYQVAANQGGNAVWMDTTHILVQDLNGGVQELNTQTRTSQQTWALKTGRLTFYRQPYLYFVGATNLEADALYRANLSQANPTPQQITNPLPGTRFWLSIDGTTIFYANRSSSSVEGIYAVGSDGKKSRILRKGPAIPIGYADDNALIVLEQVQNKFQVIKLGATAKEQDKVIFADAAPGAVSLCGLPDLVAVIKVCDQNIALAPYGHGLLLHAYYADGTNGLVYDNLDTGLSQIIRTLPASTSVQLPGWSKMSFAHTAAAAFSSLAA
jgi:hypothetical protein